MGPTVQMSSRPGNELSWGRNGQGAKRPEGETFRERIVLRANWSGSETFGNRSI